MGVGEYYHKVIIFNAGKEVIVKRHYCTLAVRTFYGNNLKICIKMMHFESINYILRVKNQNVFKDLYVKMFNKLSY